MCRIHCAPEHENWKQRTFIILPVPWGRNLGGAKPGLSQGCNWDVSWGWSHLKASWRICLQVHPWASLRILTTLQLASPTVSTLRESWGSSGQISHYNLISEVISHHLVMFCLFKVSYWVYLTLKKSSIRAGEAGINAAIFEAVYHNAWTIITIS